MSWHQARAVLDIEGMPSSQKHVLMALSLRAGNDGRAWPSIARLCADTALSDKTVRRSIGALADAGYLVVRRIPGRGLAMTVMHTPVTTTAPLRSPRPRPRSNQPKTAVMVTGRSNKEVNQEARDGNGPAPGETWGEYRERGGR